MIRKLSKCYASELKPEMRLIPKKGWKPRLVKEVVGYGGGRNSMGIYIGFGVVNITLQEDDGSLTRIKKRPYSVVEIIAD